MGAELGDFRAGEVDFATAFEVAGFAEVVGEGAGEDVDGVFKGGFGDLLIVGLNMAKGWGLSLRVDVDLLAAGATTPVPKDKNFSLLRLAESAASVID